jgi:hypothetical protein
MICQKVLPPSHCEFQSEHCKDNTRILPEGGTGLIGHVLGDWAVSNGGLPRRIEVVSISLPMPLQCHGMLSSGSAQLRLEIVNV